MLEAISKEVGLTRHKGLRPRVWRDERTRKKNAGLMVSNLDVFGMGCAVFPIFTGYFCTCEGDFGFLEFLEVLQPRLCYAKTARWS